MGQIFDNIKSINTDIKSESKFQATAYCTRNRFLAKTAELMMTSSYEKQDNIMNNLRKQEIQDNIK